MSTATRSPSRMASSMSWVTKTIVLRKRRCRLEQLLLQAEAHDRIDRAERLVHQQHRRIGGQRAGHADPLLLAARQLARIARRDSSRLEADQRPSARPPAPGALAVPARAAAGRWRCCGRWFGAGTGRPAGSRSRSTAAARAASAWRTSRPATVMRARRGLDQPVDHAQRGRLAAARRPDQHGDLALGHLEAQAADGRRRRPGKILATCSSSIMASGHPRVRLTCVPASSTVKEPADARTR